MITYKKNKTKTNLKRNFRKFKKYTSGTLKGDMNSPMNSPSRNGIPYRKIFCSKKRY